jgi:hypothetical protein
MECRQPHPCRTHVVFTLPAAIADIAYQSKAVIHDILFTTSAETMTTIAADPPHLHYLGASHTWGSAMTITRMST